MQGGTFARAREAGFSDRQAAFFANLGADTRSEAINFIKSELKLRNETERLYDAFRIAILVFAVALAFMAGNMSA